MPDKKDYFENIGTPDEKMRLFGVDTTPDWQLQPAFTLSCPVCQKNSVYDALDWGDIWTWGFDGEKELDSRLERLVNHLQDRFIKRCPGCGAMGALDNDSCEKLREQIRESVEQMPDGGADWAKKALERFLVFHRWGFFEYQYQESPDGFGSRSVHPWLPKVCDCERCEKIRHRSTVL